jgi:hypothetical protein
MGDMSTLTITTMTAAGLPRTRKWTYLSEGDALDAAAMRFDEDDKRQRKDPHKLPALDHMSLERPAGSAVSGPELRRLARMVRD